MSSSKSKRNKMPDPGTPPTNINPYEILSVETTASAADIRKAYLKLALTTHPDKASPGAEREKAHVAFQQLTFAYGILSDPVRRSRYDTTGSTKESEEGDFDWAKFYRNQFADVVTVERIDEIRKEYQGSEEEREDILAAYEESKGKMAGVWERVMLSDESIDDKRFRTIIDEAIKNGDVEEFPAYKESRTKAAKDKRAKKAKKEAKEAEDYAKELGVYDKLFGKKGDKKTDDTKTQSKKPIDHKHKQGEAELDKDSGDESEDDDDDEDEDFASGDDDEDSYDEDEDEGDDVRSEVSDDEEEFTSPPRRGTRRSSRAAPPKPAPKTTRSSRAKPAPKPAPKTSKARGKKRASPSDEEEDPMDSMDEGQTHSPTPPPKPAPKRARKAAKKDDEADIAGLAELIRSRQKQRHADMGRIFDRYSGGGLPPPPSEEEFKKTEARLEKQRRAKK